ncbi:DoxX family protein [Flavobacterium sp. LHD-80]|uniref:DoxX family protein n=1 Tax=Flavobacterium sp. LHD-80 TaxID=3071411 RepID=UPI0027DF6DE6|nr:DoxX family protein [Flavobacterium sp. LHD-80]MDQ6472747.1 DoxX family protein [Flavobacterium sp. LHD-80]
MILNAKKGLKKYIIEVVCLLYILLFVYAAVSKLLDFENFQAELAQSPLFSAFAHWLSWVVLITELTIALLLIFPVTQIKALYAGYCLMVMFTAYIFIILNYSSFVPCSCGGILEKMSWETHLYFNVFCVVLAALALWLNHPEKRYESKIIGMYLYPYQLFFTFALSSGAVVVLFLSSEKIIHYQNPFIRRYPHHPVTLIQTIDLEYNSYYFAGAGDGKIYLGNSTVPLYLLSIDANLKQQKIRVTFNQKSFLFKSTRIVVRPPYFYILDGRVPAIFVGRIKDWKAKLQKNRPPYFNIAEPVDSNTVVFRGISKINRNNVLGIFTSIQEKTNIASDLLQKQIDGVFDTDGMLHYSSEMKKIVYLYSYRNQYIVADQNGELDYRGKTIDTISHAQIKVAYLKNKTERTLAAPALTVNKNSYVYGHLLFVNSNVPGRYEQNQVWKQTSVIDVYDLNKKTYLLSFPIYGIDHKKLRNFVVTPTHLYALIDTKLVVYQLNDKLKNEINHVSENKF